SLPLIERHAGQRHTAVADRAEDESDRQILEAVRGTRAQAAVARVVQFILHDAQAGYLPVLVADDLDRRDEDPDDEAARLAGRLVLRKRLHHLDVLQDRT